MMVKEGVGFEMYDVFWTMCDLASMLGVDLDQCFAKKIDVRKQRDWNSSTGSRE